MKIALLILLLALSVVTSVFAGVYTPQTVPNPKHFNFNYELFNLWGIGKAETNRGLLITVSYDARKMFMSTGTSLESDLTDASCLYIQKHYMLPHFKNGDYDKGLIEGVVAVYGYLTNDKVKSKIIKAAESNGSVSDTVLAIIVVFSIILLAWIVSWFSKDSDDSGGSSGSYSSSSYSSSSSSSSSRGSWGGGSTSGGGAGSSW